MIGKKIRLRKILRGNLRTTIVAVDHGLEHPGKYGRNYHMDVTPES